MSVSAHVLPWTERSAADHVLSLRGRSPSGWVVTDFDGRQHWPAWVVSGDTRREVDLASVNNDERSWMVARDGGSLLKREYTEGFASLRVTSVEDGALVADRDVDAPGQLLVGPTVPGVWETPTSIIFAVSRDGLGDVNALARCGLDGSCTRATSWRQLRLFSLVRAPQPAS